MQKVKWQQGCTYCEISKQYVAFLRKRFGSQVTVVFYGYGSGPNVKDHEHERWAASGRIFRASQASVLDQGAFFLNKTNKKFFISYFEFIGSDFDNINE